MRRVHAELIFLENGDNNLNGHRKCREVTNKWYKLSFFWSLAKRLYISILRWCVRRSVIMYVGLKIGNRKIGMMGC